MALLSWSACQDDTLLTLTIEDESSTQVEQGTILEELAGTFGFGDFVSMDITASQELQNQGVGPGDIRDVRLTLLSLSVPEGQDLSFLDSVDVYVEAPGLDAVLIASQDAFPEGEPVVDLDLEDVDLTDYAVSQSMTLSTEVSGSRPSEDTTVTAAYALDVGVTTQGACNYVANDTAG